MKMSGLMALAVAIGCSQVSVVAQSSQDSPVREFGLILGDISVLDFDALKVGNQGSFPIFGGSGIYYRQYTSGGLYFEPQLVFQVVADDNNTATAIGGELALGSDLSGGNSPESASGWYGAARIGLVLVDAGGGSNTTLGAGASLGKRIPVLGDRAVLRAEARVMHWFDYPAVDGFTVAGLVFGFGVAW